MLWSPAKPLFLRIALYGMTTRPSNNETELAPRRRYEPFSQHDESARMEDELCRGPGAIAGVSAAQTFTTLLDQNENHKYKGESYDNRTENE